MAENLHMGTLSSAAVVEEFVDQWRNSDLRGKMPEPMAIDNRGVVELTVIAVFDQFQRQGCASRAIKMLTALCDCNGLTIALVARPLPPEVTPGCAASLSADQLAVWYGSHGFVDAHTPGDDIRTMVRAPIQRCTAA
jgi:hypothetical protein